MRQTLRVVGASDAGFQRTRNEDCLLVGGLLQRDGFVDVTVDVESMLFERYGLLCAVADGMGGHQGGALASRLALEALALETFDLAPRCTSKEDLGNELASRIGNIHRMLITRGEADDELRGMGTTLAAAFFRPSQLILATVGDSRTYRFREGYLMQVTVDQAVSIGGEVTGGPVNRRVLTNSIGGGSGLDCRPEIDSDISFKPGDVLLICTDGLAEAVEECRIRDLLRKIKQLRFAAESLIEMARDQRAADNVTVLLASFEEDGKDG